MTQHLTIQQLEAYRGRELRPAELLAADDHLAACAVCRAGLLEATPPPHVAIAGLLAELRELAAAPPQHLDYDEQLVPFVDNTIDEVGREIVRSHLSICPRCTAEARELQAFKAEMACSAEPPAESSAVPKTLTLGERLAAAWQGVAAWLPLQAVAVAAVAVLVIGIGALSLRRYAADAPDQLAHRQSSQDADVSPQTDVAVPTPDSGSEVTMAQPSEEPPEGQPRSAPARKSAPATAPGTQPAAAAPVLVALNDGGRNRQITLDAQGNLRGVEALPPSLRQRIKTALAEQRVNGLPQPADLAGRSSTLLGGVDNAATSAGPGGRFALQAPVGIVVESDQPVLRWQPLAGAASYRVAIFDQDFAEVAHSGALTTTEWRLPRSLKRGGVYSWQVTASTDKGAVTAPAAPAPEAKFKVVEPEKAAELAGARRTHGDSPLVLGVLYAEAGLVAEAEEQLQKVVAANPRSAVAKRLLRSLRAERETK